MTRPDAGQESLEEALTRLAGELLGFLRHHTGDEDVAADIAQDALAQALVALDGLRDARALRGWLFRIAVNLFNDRLRRRTWRRPEEEAGGWGECICPRPAPDRRALARELDHVLRQEMARLPERQRSVLMLHGLEGLDQGDIARLLGVSRAAVKMSLHRARERMRVRLAGYLGRALGPGGRRP